MKTLGEQFKELYKAGEIVKVEFEKRDGTIRTMVCERKKEMEEAVKGAITKKHPTTAPRKKRNSPSTSRL